MTIVMKVKMHSLFIPEIQDRNDVVMANNKWSVICDCIDLVFSVATRVEGEHFAPKVRHLDWLIDEMVGVEDNGYALLVLGVADVVQLRDGEEGLGEVNVVQVEVFQDPPDQAMLNYLPNLEREMFSKLFQN